MGVAGPIAFAWGKSQCGEYHRLVHHCADVAACFEALAALATMRDRMERSAGLKFSEIAIARLAVLVFLHDAGKLHPGFQAKGWPLGAWKGPMHGHVAEGAFLYSRSGVVDLSRRLLIEDLNRWNVDPGLLAAVFAHHGRPVSSDRRASSGWEPIDPYDPQVAAAELGEMARLWFPGALVSVETPLPSAPDFQHFFCGLVSLADWLGSDRRVFEFVAALDRDHIEKARARARKAAYDVGLDVHRLRRNVEGRATFPILTGRDRPRPAQASAAEFSLDERLVILEAETGSGKTEAALWRFARLFEAGRVDSLYFALPTRAAAVQIHKRVHAAMSQFFAKGAPEAVLAVPGYLRVGEAQGHSLPDWRVRWDDSPDEATVMARWAAESAKRYLAATIAVGTVDQAMLAGLQVKHAHLRSAALSRSLLVIDEVHASDHYMTEVQNQLLKIHLQRGGYAMLMSATLGAAARAKWLGRQAPRFIEAVAEPYPAVWGRSQIVARGVLYSQRQKTVVMETLATMSAKDAASRAVAAACGGARVLVVRNTVKAAIETWHAVRAIGEDRLLLRVAEGPALHHGRFAPEDRKLLDEAVEAALSPQAERRAQGSVIAIGTQTLEQSLDVDADLLITDLCPVDVLLQRIGRLHRHDLTRPRGFETPRCIVLVPEAGLAPLLKPAVQNGLGGWVSGGVVEGIDTDLSILELTRRLVEAEPLWSIPPDNRRLVESAIHPERIETLHAELGRAWADYSSRIIGKNMADAGAARNVALPVNEPFSEVQFPSDEERIRTRLGAKVHGSSSASR
jgi:CRISPR-associated endonuclease/helicase Cas3